MLGCMFLFLLLILGDYIPLLKASLKFKILFMFIMFILYLEEFCVETQTNIKSSIYHVV